MSRILPHVPSAKTSLLALGILMRLRAHKVKVRESVAKSLECVNEKNCIWRGENASMGLLRFK